MQRLPYKTLACPGGFIKEELDIQDKIWEIKLIKSPLDERECEEFEMALQHKSKL